MHYFLLSEYIVLCYVQTSNSSTCSRFNKSGDRFTSKFETHAFGQIGSHDLGQNSVQNIIEYENKNYACTTAAQSNLHSVNVNNYTLKLLLIKVWELPHISAHYRLKRWRETVHSYWYFVLYLLRNLYFFLPDQHIFLPVMIFHID